MGTLWRGGRGRGGGGGQGGVVGGDWLLWKPWNEKRMKIAVDWSPKDSTGIILRGIYELDSDGEMEKMGKTPVSSIA